MFELDPGRWAGVPVGELPHAHPLLAAFVRQRGHAPDVGEATRGLTTRLTTRNLHAGRSRGITWFDRDHGICWLLGGGDAHSAGQRDDIYRTLVALDARGLLFPTERDYLDVEEALEPSPGLIAELRDGRDNLLEQARDEPGKEIRRKFGKDVLGVGVLVEVLVANDGDAEMVWIGFAFLEHRAVLGASVAELVPALLPPEADFSQLSFPRSFPHRPRMPGEYVFRWDHYLGDTLDDQDP
jgi:hypothetical protein